jgi:hypothetical protein
MVKMKTAIESALDGEPFDHDDIRIKLFNILSSDPNKAFTLDEICERLLGEEEEKGYTKDRIRRTFSILYRLELAMFEFETMSYKLRESRNTDVLRNTLHLKQQI